MHRQQLKKKRGTKKVQAWGNRDGDKKAPPKRQQNKKTRPKNGKTAAEGGDGYKSGSDEDYSDTQNERAKDYRKGGYHPVAVGELYNKRYRVVQKLGWGYFSTVWLVWDYDYSRFSAMKVQKSAQHYRDAAMDEIKLLSEIMQGSETLGESCGCARMTDFFDHKGPNGLHVVMIFDVLGENLLKLIERYEYRGIPIPIVKNIARQVLVGLNYIHSLNIIHTDIKPENVLFTQANHRIQTIMKNYSPIQDRSKGLALAERDPKTLSKAQKKRLKLREKKKNSKAPGTGENAPPAENGGDGVVDSDDDVPELPVAPANPEDAEPDPDWELNRIQNVTLADFGNGCWTHKQFTDEIQTRQYRSPEVILGTGYDCSADLWSAACMFFELLTGEFLFDPKEGNYERDEDHLALIVETLGPMPDHIACGDGKFRDRFLTSRGEFRHITELKYWPLERVLHEKYRFTKKKARELTEFLLPMLQIDPANRYNAAEMLREMDWFFELQEDDYPPLCYDMASPGDKQTDVTGGGDEDYATDDDEEGERDGDDRERRAQTFGEELQACAEKFGVTPEQISAFLSRQSEGLDADSLEKVKMAVQYLLPDGALFDEDSEDKDSEEADEDDENEEEKDMNFQVDRNAHREDARRSRSL